MTNLYFPSRADGPSFRKCARAIWVVAGIANNYMTACGYSVQVAAFKFQTSKSERNRHACAYSYGSQGKLHPDEEQAVQTAAGIRVNGATNCTIRENYVAGPGPDKLFFVGLDVLDGSSSVFNCNTFTELGTGTSAGRFYQEQVR